MTTRLYTHEEAWGMTDLISRADAIEAVRMSEHRITIADEQGGFGTVKWDMWGVYTAEAVEAINALPSADAVDCTDFIEWLVDRVLDETIWENNSVAYGEIICRKLEELGVLEVTEEPSYYIRPSDDTKESYLNAFYDGFNTATLALHAEAEWIPCSERLPSVGKGVLFCDSKWTEEGCLLADGDWWQFRWSAVMPKEKVTAWMPLPKPYREDGEV